MLVVDSASSTKRTPPTRYSKLLGDIEAKLAAFRMLLPGSGPPSGGSDLLSQALSLVEKVRVLARDGGIGYRLFVAEKLG